MTDKTQLEAIKELLTEYACAFTGAHGRPGKHKRDDAAQQILDLCQPKWTSVNEQNPYEIHKDNNTRKRVIFRYFEGGDYWSLEPEPPEESE